MKIVNRSIVVLLVLVAGLLIAGAGVASCQDVYKVNYFDINAPVLGRGLPVPDATVRIDNPGLTYGNLCAMIYVYAADQQLSECCGCTKQITALRKLSVRNNLTGNPLTGVAPIYALSRLFRRFPVLAARATHLRYVPRASLSCVGNPYSERDFFWHLPVSMAGH